MDHFFTVKTVDEVLGLVADFPVLPAETVSLARASGRVLAEDVLAGEDVPQFDRSTMDGYAVRARDTFGANESLPALFTVVGEIVMGREPSCEVGPGRTALIWTGGMMPPGANAVVPVEYARRVDESTVELARPVAPYEYVIRRGEDVRRGDMLLPKGRRLRPQDMGLLAALGRESLLATRRPRVAVISTGNEVVPVGSEPGPGQVRDVNTYTLGALVELFGAESVSLGLVRDEPDDIHSAVSQAMQTADVVAISGGSSVGVRDYTVEVFRGFEGSKILVHGVSVSPGKPTIMARVGDKSLWGLPGHTVSAMITADLFLRPLLLRLSGESESRPVWGRTVRAVMSRNVPSVHGRQDYIRVRIEAGPDSGLTAHPVLGKSGLISTMVRADGLVCIPLNDEGMPKGAEVEVRLFD
ncbi:MAG: molybdopterin molybdotransferase MoeA [Proteobacteria bacterium]|nr:molybdopterin molybdotransferase MoeA [Pseudomonadota bacterium]